MKQFLPSLIIFSLALINQNLQAQNNRPHTSKEPAWVTLHTINYGSNRLESEAEDGSLDLDYEEQISLSAQSHYYKRALKILSEAGVQNSSEVSVGFDPAYEQLTFHSIKIVRDGQAINKLNLSNFKVIQQEKDLSRHMYDGSLTALLLLDDVRKGDVVEYSYTIKGLNPIFGNRYSDFFDLRFSVPTCNLSYRVLVPKGRNLVIKNLLTDMAPVVSQQQNETAYEWKATDVAALHTEKKTPGWYDPFPCVMVSEFKNWQEVSTWSAALFPRNLHLSAPLQSKIESIKAANSTNENRMLAALRFVQDDIRYMGIEMGVNSHKPSPPDKIFAQRFGDCKDKSYLLTTMLNAMGIEADPVLINTVAKKALANWLPMASAFDHVTVRAVLNGKAYWFDPTISWQRGPLKSISYPDYQTGLIINPASTALTIIPFREAGMCDTKEFFSIPDMSGIAQFKVVTKNTGSFADNTRDYFNNNSVYEMKNKYKDFYAAYFDKITADSLTYADDETTGAFTTTEYYTVKDLWKYEDGAQKSSFYSYLINSIMTKPADKTRTMPFSLAYPARYKESLEIELPEAWNLETFDQNINCAAFTLKANGRSEYNKIYLNYEYESLKDHVLPGEASSFFANFDEANKVTAYTLTYKNTNSGYASSSPLVNSSGSSTSVFPKLYTLLGICVLVTVVVRRQNQKQY